MLHPGGKSPPEDELAALEAASKEVGGGPVEVALDEPVASEFSLESPTTVVDELPESFTMEEGAGAQSDAADSATEDS